MFFMMEILLDKVVIQAHNELYGRIIQGGEEGFLYLTLGMVKQEDGWKADFYGLEM